MKAKKISLSVITITLSIIINGIFTGSQAAPAVRNSTIRHGINSTVHNDLDSISPSLKRAARLIQFPYGAWLNFDITREGNNTEWRWQLQSDDNVESYIPQYSSDGIEFYDAGKITLFNDDHNYNFTRPLSVAGALYYRIKQTNLDGTETYSPVRAPDEDAPVSITTYPNPAITDINMTWPYKEATSVTISISNNMGKILKQQTIVISDPIRIDLSGLPQGIYYLFGADNKGHRSQTTTFSKLP